MSNPLNIYESAVSLLIELIATPSFSKEEHGTADILERFMRDQHLHFERDLNNVWSRNKHFDPGKPTLLLNSHHDTVRPHSDYTRDAFEPSIEDGKLFGLGSNDAGGALVSLLATYMVFYDLPGMNYNLVFAATAEEEISGVNGIACILDRLPEFDAAIVGEPTQMQMATAEKGLMVLDCVASGKSGHAARDEGDNALYKAVEDIKWIEGYKFDKESPLLGKVKMTTTVIRAGREHNVIPSLCDFTVDVRTTDAYTNREVLEIVDKHLISKVTPRSLRLQPSSIDEGHPLVRAGLELGRTCYGSPTLSDQALIPVPSLKMGPGDSARSHGPDEYIALHEIQEGIDIYTRMLRQIL